jgi:hypothetical protein
MKPAWSHFLVSLMVLTACSHSDPFPTGPQLGDGSYDQIEPIRLTFSPGDDGWPTVSADGQWISYRYARGTADRDFCAGLLPIAGGQRLASLCAWETNDVSRSDDFRSAVLLDDQTVAYTRYSSGTGNQSPQEAGLYVAPLDALRDAREVLPLLGRPAGGSDNYLYLLGPVREDDHTILVLATKAYIGPKYANGPVDTTYRGVEISRIDVATTPAGVTPVAPATDAVGWAFDPSTRMAYFRRPTYSAQPGSGSFAVVADTIFRVSLAGGTPEAVFGRAPVAGEYEGALDGFAVVEGRLFVSQHSTRILPSPPGGFETRSEVGEVQPDGSLDPLNIRLTLNGALWTRLAASPDGHSLVAASVLLGQRDLYRFDLQ